jgi:urease accessory protein
MPETPTAHLLHRAFEGPAEDSVTLDYEGRFLRRRLLGIDAGGELLVDLPETVSLDEGDVLETTCGRRIAVRAAPEPLVAVMAEGAALARIAWHVGNRHTPAQIEPGRLLIRADRVMEDMLVRLGADTAALVAPFTPERGAYGQGRTHGHDHRHDLDHRYEHRHEHGQHGHGHAPE